MPVFLSRAQFHPLQVAFCCNALHPRGGFLDQELIQQKPVLGSRDVYLPLWSDDNMSLVPVWRDYTCKLSLTTEPIREDQPTILQILVRTDLACRAGRTGGSLACVCKQAERMTREGT